MKTAGMVAINDKARFFDLCMVKDMTIGVRNLEVQGIAVKI
jgi:hypothetical protein